MFTCMLCAVLYVITGSACCRVLCADLTDIAGCLCNRQLAGVGAFSCIRAARAVCTLV